jgi:hypothetical protein
MRLEIQASTSIEGHATAFPVILTCLGKSPVEISLYKEDRFKPVRSKTDLHRYSVTCVCEFSRIFLPIEDALCRHKKGLHSALLYKPSVPWQHWISVAFLSPRWEVQ